jgi:hypothetical protein
MIHATAQPVTRQTTLSYRASVEIVKDGQRVERSGLVGPTFPDYESAERHALEWAREWIDRHTSAAAAVASNATAAAIPTKNEEQGTLPLAATISDLAPSVPCKPDPAAKRNEASHWPLHHPDGRDAKPPELLYLS